MKAKAPENAAPAVSEPTKTEPTTKKNFGKETMALHDKGGQRAMSDIPESEFVYSDFAKANIVIKKFLDHSEITAEPDTLARTAKRDTSTITVQAKDKNDQDIMIPDKYAARFCVGF